MNADKKVNILGCCINMVTMPEAINRIEYFLTRGNPAHIITLNAEIAYLARSDPKLQAIINSAELVTPDGIGIVWAARQLGKDIRERVTGIDMIYKISERAAARQWKLYLLGAAPGVAEAAAQALAALYPGLVICGTRHGYFKEEDIPAMIQEIRACSPDILMAALGAPKQEFFIKNYKDQLKVPVCVGVGGSFDVLAGHKKRAPEIMIRLNLEWLYRLISEPTRAKRQLVLPKFTMAVLKQKYGN